jgi:hypothetical protein
VAIRIPKCMVQMLKEVRYGQWRDYNPEEKEQLYPGAHDPMSSTLSGRCRMDRLSAVHIRSLLIVLACLMLVAGIALPKLWAQTVDPHPLGGKWEGTWLNISHPNVSGAHDVTVTKVEGDKVYGR